MRIASYYGFASAESVARTARSHTVEVAIRDALGSAAAHALGAHLTNPVREPVMFYHAANVGNTRIAFGLDVIGVPKSIAEAFIIKTALSIFSEVGTPEPRVYINSIGDRDSQGRFIREFQVFLRKHIEELSPRGREIMKRDLFAAFVFLSRRSHELFALAPKPMEFLSEASRRHLREVLQYLETIGISYEVDDHLVSCGSHFSQTLFEIRHRGEIIDLPIGEEEELAGETLARGGRYDELLKKTYRSPIGAVRITLSLEGRPSQKKTPLKTNSRKPKVYFIQLGFDAKLRALMLIETLRKAHVPLSQSIGTDTLGNQLAIAEKLHVPYAMIMGQKEANENTVIFRNLETRAQETVPIALLADYLRRVVH